MAPFNEQNRKIYYCWNLTSYQIKIKFWQMNLMSRGKEIRPEFFLKYCKEKHSIYACIIFVIKIKEAVICVMKLVNGTISLDLTQLCLSLDLLMQFLFVKLQQPF